MYLSLRTRLARCTRRTRQMSGAAAVTANAALTALATVGASLALTASPASATSGGVPTIESSAWEQAHLWGYKVPSMQVRLHIDGASNAKITQMVGYTWDYNPNKPFNEQTWKVDVRTGSLTLHHTGPGNIWTGKSTNKELVHAVADLKSVVTARACNNSACTTSTLTFTRV